MFRSWPLERLIKWACILALVGLALMVWSVLSPRPIPVILAMSLGQGFGTAGLVLFLVAIVADLRKAGLLGRETRSGEAPDAPGPEKRQG